MSAMNDRPTEEGYAEHHGYTLSTGALCLRRLAGQRCLLGNPDGTCDGCEERRRYLDHGRGWVRDGRLACITGEPYQLYDDDLAQLRADAERFRLKITITGASWHYPGSTALIELRPIGTSQRESELPAAPIEEFDRLSACEEFDRLSAREDLEAVTTRGTLVCGDCEFEEFGDLLSADQLRDADLREPSHLLMAIERIAEQEGWTR